MQENKPKHQHHQKIETNAIDQIFGDGASSQFPKVFMDLIITFIKTNSIKDLPDLSTSVHEVMRYFFGKLDGVINPKKTLFKYLQQCYKSLSSLLAGNENKKMQKKNNDSDDEDNNLQNFINESIIFKTTKEKDMIPTTTSRIERFRILKDWIMAIEFILSLCEKSFYIRNVNDENISIESFFGREEEIGEFLKKIMDEIEGKENHFMRIVLGFDKRSIIDARSLSFEQNQLFFKISQALQSRKNPGDFEKKIMQHTIQGYFGIKRLRLYAGFLQNHIINNLMKRKLSICHMTDMDPASQEDDLNTFLDVLKGNEIGKESVNLVSKISIHNIISFKRNQAEALRKQNDQKNSLDFYTIYAKFQKFKQNIRALSNNTNEIKQKKNKKEEAKLIKRKAEYIIAHYNNFEELIDGCISRITAVNIQAGEMPVNSELENSVLALFAENMDTIYSKKKEIFEIYQRLWEICLNYIKNKQTRTDPVSLFNNQEAVYQRDFKLIKDLINLQATVEGEVALQKFAQSFRDQYEDPEKFHQLQKFVLGKDLKMTKIDGSTIHEDILTRRKVWMKLIVADISSFCETLVIQALKNQPVQIEFKKPPVGKETAVKRWVLQLEEKENLILNISRFIKKTTYVNLVCYALLKINTTKRFLWNNAFDSEIASYSKNVIAKKLN